jgi:hypothetical protein
LPVGIILAIFLDQILLNIHQMSFLRFSLWFPPIFLLYFMKTI